MYKRLFFHVRTKYGLLLSAFLSILAITLLEFAIPQLVQYTIDSIIPNSAYSQLLWVGFGILAASAFLGLFQYITTFSMAKIGQQAIFELRNELYRHIQYLDMKFFDRNRTGDLMSRVTSDIGMMQQLISSGMLQIITDVFIFVGIVSYMFFANWKLTVIALATFPLMYFTTRYFSKRMRGLYRNVQKSNAEVSNHLQDTLSGIRLIKAFASEEYESERFAARSRENMLANLASVKLRNIYEPIIDWINYLGYAAVLGFGAWFAMHDKSLTIGSIVAFLAYLRLLQSPVRHFSRLINTIQQSAAAYERIVEILAAQPDTIEAEGAQSLPPVGGRIEMRDIAFAYQAANPVLHHFNLVLEAGQTTALVGSSGSGKSTIAHLIARFYDPQEGNITIDGIPIRDVTLRSLREQIGIVSQDNILLNGTIRENICYGKPDASDEEMIAAAKAANAHDFILSFEHGYDSAIGERGVKLSGGQKQRLSIARALLKNPRIVILDEATAALDTESETLIQQALATLLAGRTCLIIAHRLSTIQNADRICVLEKGTIIESGTHSTLLAENGRYKTLYELQFPQKAAFST